MEQMRIQITNAEGACLMLHNGRLANPLDEYAKAIKRINAKGRKKTEDDQVEIYRLEFEGGLYYDPSVGVHIPAANVKGIFKDAAMAQRRGPDIARGLLILEDKIPLAYEGPRDPAKMWKEGTFADVRRVSGQGKRGGSTVMRCRPIFRPPWSYTFTACFNLSLLTKEDLASFLDYAKHVLGSFENRPEYGHFEWEEVPIE